MHKLEHLLYARATNIFLSIFLAIFWSNFAFVHFFAYLETGNITFLLFVLLETIQAGFFLFRSMPKSISLDPFDWMVAIGGTFAPLFLRPDGEVLWSSASLLVFMGLSIQFFALLSLNRSFAIIPSTRAVKTAGLYAFVRHPMYASYLFSFSGYILSSASVPNAVLLTLALSFMFLRIEREEAHLIHSPEYAEYMKHVRYRLVPFVY